MGKLSFVERGVQTGLKLEVLRSAARIVASNFNIWIAGGPENMREHTLYEIESPIPGAINLRQAHVVGQVAGYEISLPTERPMTARPGVTLSLLQRMREEAWQSETAESVYCVDDRRRGVVTAEYGVFVLNDPINLRDIGLARIHCVTVDAPRRQFIVAGPDIDTRVPTMKIMDSWGQVLESVTIVPFADCFAEHIAVFDGQVTSIVRRGSDRALVFRASGKSSFVVTDNRTSLEVIRLDRHGHVIGMAIDQYCLVDPVTGKLGLILRRKPAEYFAGIAYVQRNPHLIIQRDDGQQWRLIPYNLG